MSTDSIRPVDSPGNASSTLWHLSQSCPGHYDGSTDSLRDPDGYQEPEVLDEDPIARSARVRRSHRPFNMAWFINHTAQRLFGYPIPPCEEPTMNPQWESRLPDAVLLANDVTEEGLELIGEGLELWHDGREMEARAKFEATKALLERLTPEEAAESAREAVQCLEEALGHFGERDIEKAVQGFWDAWPLVTDLLPEKAEEGLK